VPTVVIIGDTHVPSRAREFPEWVEERVRAADHVVHAGDFDSRRAYDHVRSLAADLTAVVGNTDPGYELDLPTTATLVVDGVEFVVVHGNGQGDYDQRVLSAVRAHGGPDAVGVGGHTHRPRDDVVEGVRLLNAGSATGANPDDVPTLIEATVEGDDLDVAFHRG
jgi:putative phosphoesterase